VPIGTSPISSQPISAYVAKVRKLDYVPVAMTETTVVPLNLDEVPITSGTK
jgi:hypothetical protein